MVSSPCTNDCALENGTCTSCGRTMEMILNWGSLSEEKRLEIMSQLKDLRDYDV